MKLKSCFTLVKAVDDYMVVPIGDEANKYGGTVILNEISAFILKSMETCETNEKIVQSILEEYDVDSETAKHDVEESIKKFVELGLVE